MLARKSIFFIFLLVVNSFFISTVYASITVNYAVISGIDASSGISKDFTANDIEKLSVSDSEPGNGIDRMRSDKWPDTGSYDESKYLEFVFNPDIPSGAVISSVSITNEYRNSNTTEVHFAKLEIWDGTSFIDQEIDVSLDTEDITNVVDISSIINSPDKVNNIKIRFLAYRNKKGNTQTSHDFISLSVTYDTAPPKEIPEEEPPIPEPVFTKITDDITEDTTWTLFDSPYIIENTIDITPGATLSIEPGVVIKFIPSYSSLKNSINVLGKIIVNGEENNKVYFTSNYDDEVGGSTDDDGESCDDEVDADGNPTGVEICGPYDTGDPASGDWGGLYFDDSLGSVFKNTVFRYANDNTFVLYKSTANLENVTLENSKEGIILYENSHLDFAGVVLKNITEDALVVFNNSSVNFKDLIIRDVADEPVTIFNDSSFTGENLRIENITSTYIFADVINIFNNSDLSIKDSYFKDCLIGACIDFFDGKKYLDNPSSVNIENTVFDGGLGSGLLTFSDSNINVVVKNSTFKNFTFFAIENHSDFTINAENNYWGDASGPYHETLNMAGLGEALYGNVDFEPWCENESCIVTPVRNPVIIIPGVMGTEIFSSLEKLWLDFLHNFKDIGDEFMDPLQFNDDLTPLVEGLTVGDVIRKVFIPLFNFDYTEGLIKEFQDQGYVEDTDLFLFPYDWRYGVSGDNVLKLKQKIADILTQSGGEKVDIIAHSTGGLLLKKYVIENKDDHKIDKAIFVGVPNTGAPQAIKTFLEGSNFSNPFLDKKEMKKLAKNLPVVYDLSPSEQYYNTKGSFIKIINQGFLSSTSNDLNFQEINDFLINDHSLNNKALENAHNLHTFDFDNYDLRTNGIDLYSVNGCKAGTLGKIIEKRFVTDTNYIYQIKNVPGDGTVPLESATNLPINEDHKYFALKTEHSKMLSDNGIRQQIVNIISNSNLETKNISQDITKCKLKGRAIAVYSPVAIDVTDQDRNHLGLSADGVSIENNIPNALFEIMGEEKFLYLPDDEGQIYTITLQGIDEGVFTLTDTKIENDIELEMQVFRDINVTKLLTGKFTLGELATLELDTDNNGTFDQNLMPTILDTSSLIDFDPTHKIELKSEPKTVIPNNPVVVSSGGSGYPAPPIVVAQSSEFSKDAEIIVQKENEIVPNISLVEKAGGDIVKIKIAQKTKDISFEEEILNQPIDTDKTETKEKTEELNLQGSAFSSDINIKPIILIIIFLSIISILLLIKKFGKFKNL